jgi:enamine deaminase RidA (YjgF/YER057c/UK114 family)
VNQADLLDGRAGTSVIGQAPLPAAKFALWAYHICDPGGTLGKTNDGMTVSCRRGGLTHHWTAGMTDIRENTSHHQTHRVLENYGAWLHSHGMNMADHVVRTWWFVRNIDADYQGLVDARRDFFNRNGLTADTHYIASTGIAGAHREVAAKVSLDSYAIDGLRQEQVDYLCAPDHLCPTHDYGVTFERATAVSYADRRHVFISGTASIDHAGTILHEGDVIRQLARTLENIEALLAKADANLGDLAVMVVYLRDPADGAVIEAALRGHMGVVPYVLVDAPVCRPGWLIEIEGIALVPANLPQLADF